jgi:hypothetical protein
VLLWLWPLALPARAADQGEDWLVLQAAIHAAALPGAGNPSGTCPVPAEAGLEDVSAPDQIIGNGTPESCTSQAVVEAVARGGVTVFECGPAPVTIKLSQTAKIVNNTGPRIVLDGGGKVTLSGGGVRRILYMNTCDPAQVWTTSHCDDQDHPRLTVQNLTFVDGNASGEEEGGGAIFARGGRLKIVNSRFFRNICAAIGQDVGGGAVRAFDQSEDRPVYVVGSTFGGRPGLGNTGSNGGAVSSIGVSWILLNTLLSHNQAVGYGANPARPGTPGGGNGGAVAADGNTFSVDLCGVRLEQNTAREGGGGIFFVSNDLTGRLRIERSVLRGNVSQGFETQGYPGIFSLGNGPPVVVDSVIE